MAEYLYSNNAASTLASGINDSALSLDVAPGTGTLFPNPSAGQQFQLTLVDGGGNYEIVKVTARSTDTFTIVRAQEGTVAQSFTLGDTVELRVTAEAMNQMVQETATQTVQNKTIDNTNTITVKDNLFTLQDGGDTGRQAAFQLSGITTGNTRTLTVPDANGTILTNTDIGSTVQAYDVDTAKLDVDQSWTGAQRGAITNTTDGTLIDLSVGNNFNWTPAAADELSFDNETAGQSGFILLNNPSAHTITSGSEVYHDSSFLTTVSAAGTYLISYFVVDSTHTYCVCSGALS